MDEKIEEMELVMHNSFGCRYFSTKDMILNNDRFFKREATVLYNAGYRKESDTAREIFEKIFEVLCCFTTQWKSENYNEGYIDCLAEVDKRLQNLAKEKYGVDLGE